MYLWIKFSFIYLLQNKVAVHIHMNIKLMFQSYLKSFTFIFVGLIQFNTLNTFIKKKASISEPKLLKYVQNN